MLHYMVSTYRLTVHSQLTLLYLRRSARGTKLFLLPFPKYCQSLWRSLGAIGQLAALIE